ncbi:MAG: HIT family protein [Bacteroidota bacterium]
MPAESPRSAEQCAFCRIIRREAPAEIIYEDDRTIALLDIRPIHHGHALIIPKTHCIDFLALPDDFLHDILKTTQIVARALVEAFQLEGFNIFSNNGRVAGQSVFHFHMHVTPRYADDDIRFVLRLKEYPDGRMNEIADKIRERIKR